MKVKANVPAAQAVAVGVAAETVGLRVSVAAASVQKETQLTAEDTTAHEFDDNDIRQQCTFMGYDLRSRAYLPHGYGDDYPAFHTHRGGVDLEVIDEMRSLFNKGLRPDSLSSHMLELKSKRYYKSYIKREHLLKRDRQCNIFSNVIVPVELYLEFADKTKFNGRVPSGLYLATCYKQYGELILNHLDNEVKKRGALRLHWDVSYKEAKHLCRYHGHQIFKGLLTATKMRLVRLGYSVM